MKYVCDVCGWEYDEEKGYPEGGIAPGTKWEDIPEDMPMELALFKKSGMKFHCLQGLYQTMSFKDITLKEIEKKP